MADLTVKVDEQEYRNALRDLRTEYNNLGGALKELKKQREKLESNFISKVLSPSLRDMIEAKENEVQKSMDNVQKQITKIENRLTSLNTAESNINQQISKAKDTHSKAFG